MENIVKKTMRTPTKVYWKNLQYLKDVKSPSCSGDLFTAVRKYNLDFREYNLEKLESNWLLID